MTPDVRVLEPDELRAANTLFGASLHHGPSDDDGWARVAPTYSPGRTFGTHVGDTLVGTATSFPTRTAVPGGAALGTAAVTRVGVRADHRRRGLLTALMRAQLGAVVEAGEELASLRASEARIYGRFGYGLASRGREVRVRADGAGWRPDAPRAGSVRLLGSEEAVPVLAGLHEGLALGRPGGIRRPLGWWRNLQRRLDDREHVVVAVHAGPGGDDGFAVAGPAPAAERSFGRTLRVDDLHAADIAATVGLWRFLLDVDLVVAVTAELRPLDEPLELLLADPRDCAVVGQEDETWLRIVDVPAALAARSYGAAGPVLIAVHDTLLAGNAGVYRIADGDTQRVGPLGGPVEPELECDVAALAMAYLGDRAPSTLVATGWWRARTPTAVGRADALFRTAAAPWCGTYF